MATSAIVVTKATCRPTSTTDSRYTRAGAASTIRHKYRQSISRVECTHCASV